MIIMNEELIYRRDCDLFAESMDYEGMIYDKCGPRVSNILGYIFLPGCLIILYRLIESSYTSINLIVFLNEVF